MAGTQAMAPATDLDGEPGPRLVVVTGAAGHLGANLVRALLSQGESVRALVREHRRGVESLPVEIVHADVLDAGGLQRAFAGADRVCHLAGKISAGWEPARAVMEVNVEGTRNVVAACMAARVPRLLHMSSIQALARLPGKDTIDEDSPLVPPGARDRGAYDLAKAEAERIVLAGVAEGLDAVILNPTAILGPCDFQTSPLGAVLLDLARGRLPALIDGAHQDFVDVRDVAAATVAAMRRGRRGERYLLPGTRLSLVELARKWAEVTGRPAPRISVPMGLARLAAPFAPAWARLRGRRPLFTSGSLRMLRAPGAISRRKAEAELGHRPRPVDETLRDVWAWMKAEGRA